MLDFGKVAEIRLLLSGEGLPPPMSLITLQGWCGSIILFVQGSDYQHGSGEMEGNERGYFSAALSRVFLASCILNPIACEENIARESVKVCKDVL